MKKYLFLLILLFSDFSFAALKQVNWQVYSGYLVYSCPNGSEKGPCPTPPGSFGSNPVVRDVTNVSRQDTCTIDGSSTLYQNHSCYAAPNPCTLPEVPTVFESGNVGCEPPEPPPPAGSSASSAASSRASSAASSANACPSGQTRDSNGTCSTCTGGQVLNLSNGACENKTSCTFPERYASYNNACGANPNNCAINTGYNPITEESCYSYPYNSAPTCPAGWSLQPNNTCAATANGNSSSGSGSSAASSTPSNNASSTPSNNASSTPSNNSNSSASPKPPTNSGDNTDQGQSTSGSQSIPPDTSNTSCAAAYGATACKVMEDCKLTFGGDRCVGVTGNVTCPNSYVVNGQKVCVLPAQNSGSNGSASSSGSSGGGGSGGDGEGEGEGGECDPEAKNYLECISPSMKDFPEHSKPASGAQDIDQVNVNFQNRVKNSPVVKSFDKIKNVVSLSNPVCPEFSFELFGKTIGTTIHCSLWATIALVLSPIMIAVWSIVAFRIFASA